MVRAYQLSDGKILDGDMANSQVLFFVNPDEEEKKFLASELALDEHTLASALDPDEIARLEFEPDHTALIVKRPKSYSATDLFLFRVSSMGIFLFNERLVIVSPEEFTIFEDRRFLHVRSIREIMLKLVNLATLHFNAHLRVIHSVSDELELKINESMENKYLIYMFTLEKSLVYYLNAINANSLMLQKLKNYEMRLALNSDEKEFLDDIQIENTQCYKQAEIYSDILGGLMDARASIVNNNLNQLMKTLNIITILLMVPTLVVSMFSMNVDFPYRTHHLAFYAILGLAVMASSGFYAFWRLRKW